MTELLTEEVLQLISQVESNYYRLIFIVAPAGAGKTAVLQDIATRKSAPMLNVNLELSRRMLELTERQRSIEVSKLLNEIVESADSELVLLDNIEILFDLALKQDPLRLLQTLSRNTTLVVAWNGRVEKEQMTYALPEHPEYKRYPIKDFIVVNKETNTIQERIRT